MNRFSKSFALESKACFGERGLTFGAIESFCLVSEIAKWLNTWGHRCRFSDFPDLPSGKSYRVRVKQKWGNNGAPENSDLRSASHQRTDEGFRPSGDYITLRGSGLVDCVNKRITALIKAQ